MKTKIFLISSVLVFSIPSWAEVETKNFEAGNIKTLDVHNGAGYTNVIGIQSNKFEIKADKVTFDEHCNLIMEVKKDVLQVDLRGDRNSKCKVNFDIQVPLKTNITLDNGSGDAKIKGTSGNIKYDLGSGDTSIEADGSELKGDSGSGSLTVNGWFKDAAISIGSGHIQLTYLQCPDHGTISIMGGSGDADIYLPADSLIRATHMAGSGKFETEFTNAQNPKLVISMQSGSGDLTLKKIKK